MTYKSPSVILHTILNVDNIVFLMYYLTNVTRRRERSDTKVGRKRRRESEKIRDMKQLAESAANMEAG